MEKDDEDLEEGEISDSSFHDGIEMETESVNKDVDDRIQKEKDLKLISRKQNSTYELLLEEPASKRLRTDKDAPKAAGISCWPDDTKSKSTVIENQREIDMRLEEQKTMFASKKLSLVLDLDHTLLHSATVDSTHKAIIKKKKKKDRKEPYRHLFRVPNTKKWTKLRPGIWNFLEKASKLYTLHISTMGNQSYATEMAKLLDPKGVLFNGRVMSKRVNPVDEEGRVVPKTKDLEGVMGMESSIVIVDDTVRVWPHNKMNLIVVQRYNYFPSCKQKLGLPGPFLLEEDSDERPDEGTLASILAVLEIIHKNFFSHASLDEVDVRDILASEQQKILFGCRIMFSQIIPVDEARPHLHPLWQTAEQFGAVCTTQVDEQVTHVVASSHGTDEVNWALRHDRFVVHPDWVEASAYLYRRANESNYAINP